MVTDTLRVIKADVRSFLEASGDKDTVLAKMRRKASATGSKNAKKEARNFMKDKGATTNIRDMNYSELYMYLNYLDYHTEVYGR
jgi:hypothetical protein